MGAIHFDKPSDGIVSDDNTVALKIRATADSTIALHGETEHNKWTDAIVGISKNWVGVHGISNTDHSAIWGEAIGKGGYGVWGQTTDDNGDAGVVGISKNSAGVRGIAEGPSLSANGVEGKNTATGQDRRGAGVYGESLGNGVVGISTLGEAEPSRWPCGVKGRGPIGVRAESTRRGGAGVSGEGSIGVVGTGNNFGELKGVGVLGIGRPIAGRFKGDVEVTGDITLMKPENADCAEDFDIFETDVEPGTVMVLTENGSLKSSHQEYDKKVAGVVSGAGGYSPAMVLARQQECHVDKNNKKKSRLPIALIGKIYCKVDARHCPVEAGDLLTTSSTKGYAMKAEDASKAFGAVIGKALGSIKEGLGMIPILVTLQ
jgi:hypothetical protein